jgi:integrase
VFLGYRQGKPHRKYVTRRTRTEAVAEIRRLLEAQRQGQLVTTGSMTVGEWFATYLQQVARPKIRPRTLDRYALDVERHIVPAIGRYRLDKLRPAHLLELYNAKAAESLSGASVRHMHAVIRRALNVAVKWQLVAVNPAALVDAPQARQHEITLLSAAEARQLIRAADGDRMAARWLVGLALGLRQGEALGLWWDDIDLAAGVLRVRVHYANRHTDRSAWRLPGVQEAARQSWGIQRPAARSSPYGGEPAACSGRPSRVVMEILGHGQIALTMNTYSHVAPEVSRVAAERMARALWQDAEDDHADEHRGGE